MLFPENILADFHNFRGLDWVTEAADSIYFTFQLYYKATNNMKWENSGKPRLQNVPIFMRLLKLCMHCHEETYTD